MQLTKEEVVKFDTVVAIAVLYGLCEEGDSETLWPTEKLRVSVSTSALKQFTLIKAMHCFADCR